MRLRFEACTVDLQVGEVHWDDERRCRLTTREVALLRYLCTRMGEDVSREELHVKVWGYGVHAVTRAADDTVRRLRPKIEEDTKEPRHLITVHGEGYRLVGVVPDTSAIPVQPVLPVEDAPLVGREELMGGVQVALGEARLVTLVGPGGVGKTRLALAIAHALDAYGFVDASAARTTAGLQDHIASQLHLGEPRDVEDLSQRLAAVPGLVVLDNLEQVAEPAVDILSAWLQHRCEGRVLVTSRARLGISGERVVHVEPLAPGHGVQLVKQRLAFLGASVKEEKKLFALHKAVDGMPLALDLAAARVARLGVERVVKRLTEAPASLKAFRRTGPERHRSVWSTVEWSWELLDEVEQRVLSQAAVFRGGVTLHALEVALDGQIPADREFDACVAFLVEHSLMKLQRPGRVVLYEAVREVAESHLVDREDALRRHTKGVLACCEVNWIEHHRAATLGMLGPMRADRQNLLAVLERVRGTDQVDAWCRVVLGLSLLWVRDMKPRIAEDEIGRLLEAPGIEAFKPRLLMAYGGPLASLGRHEESLKGLEWAVIQLRKQRDTHILVFCVLALVSAYRFFGDHDAMRRHLTEARELAAGDPALLSFVVLRQAHCEYYLRNHKEALALCRQVVQENLSPESRLATEGLEAMVLFAMGDDQATAARFHGVAKQWENVGNMHGMAYALVGAAKAEEREGHTRAAAESFARAAAIFRRGGANQYADKVQKYGSDVLAGIDDTGEP